jgi:thioredoxin reductase
MKQASQVAGSSAARRSVLVVDAGHPRNAPAAHAHGYLTRDGASPLELLAAGRAEVAGYCGQIRTGTVISLAWLPSGGFGVTLADGTTVRARRMLMATGLADEYPGIPGPRDHLVTLTWWIGGPACSPLPQPKPIR